MDSPSSYLARVKTIPITSPQIATKIQSWSLLGNRNSFIKSIRCQPHQNVNAGTPTAPPTLTDSGWCDSHARDRWQDGRESASKRGYDRCWRKVREQHLRSSPLCLDCLIEGIVTAATNAHHVEKIADNPERRLDRTNLMSLCSRHHDIRTARGE